MFLERINNPITIVVKDIRSIGERIVDFPLFVMTLLLYFSTDYHARNL